MINNPPFVVVITAPAAGVGKSTLASNLVVYLKALYEDLPVALASSETKSLIKMFSLSRAAAEPLNRIFSGADFRDLLTFGEYGVEFCSITEEPVASNLPDFRKKLAATDYPGILVVDLAIDHPLLQTIIWAADLVLLPAKDPSSLKNLSELKSELTAGGGATSMLWLLPSELGGKGEYQGLANSLEFLRFAAEERDVQVLDETLFADDVVREKAALLSKPILTRAAQGQVHDQLKAIAKFIQQHQESVNNQGYRSERWKIDGTLPERASLVDVTCPLCQKAGWSGTCHYSEVLPTRKRTLIHASCLNALLAGTGGQAFLPTAQLVVVQPGVASGGRVEDVRLLMIDASSELLHAEFLSTTEKEAWLGFVRNLTGRALPELYQEYLLISAAVSVEDALSKSWYQGFVSIRRDFKQMLVGEKI